ncbi:GntP family permease [Lachnospiraceae bacterium 62-35]
MQLLLIPAFILLFAFLAYKRWSPLLLGPAVSLLLCIATGLPVLETMLGPYMDSVVGFIKSNFFVFFLGAIFGAIYEKTHAAAAIATWMSSVTKGKFALPLIMTIAGVLCYGGVLGFVVYFAVYPIALQLCKESNISRKLIPAAIGAGCWTFANALPGSPAITNVMASKNLGTAGTADLIAGILFGGLMMYILNFLYLEYMARRYRNLGDDFILDDIVEKELNEKPDEKYPPTIIAFIPMLAILILYNIVGLAVEWSLLSGVLLAFALLYPFGGNRKEWLNTFNKGAGNTCTVILNVSLVVGFAGVMKSSFLFDDLVTWIGTIRMPGLVFVAVTTATCAAASASSSGGMGVAMSTFAQTYLDMGINIQAAHRVATIAASTLDTLPHTGGQITLLGLCHQTHKDSFFHIFVTQAIIPIICLICLVIWHMILG